MLKRDWRNSLRTPHVYKVGSSTFRIQKQLTVFIVVCAALIFLYICPSIHNAILFQPFDSSSPTCYFYKYNKTYPITRPVETNEGISYRIAIISDLDERSKNVRKEDEWYSIFKTGHLLWSPSTNRLSVTWDNQDVILSSSLAMRGRGMEFSELVTFDGRLLTFDDRTGIIYYIENNKIYPWVILMDGNGKTSKGFKSEWATVKDEQLYVGSMGKEWTTASGQFENNNPQWIKIVSPRGEIHSINWVYNYKKLRKAINIEFPGYMIHESGLWSAKHQSWFFLPRRCSLQSYNETLDETMSCNVLLEANENFTDVKVTNIGTLSPTRGFSSFKFLPGSNDNIIIALKSEEYQGRMSTYILAFTIDGYILMPEMKVIARFTSRVKMDGGGAYGGGKAGAPFDPIVFIQRPQVILRALCLLFAIIVFGCISNKGYIEKNGKEYCLYNNDTNACNYGVGIGVLAFLGSVCFIVGEYLFEQMSSVKTRKHYVLLDLGFSGFWAFLYFVGFCYLTNAWNKSDPPKDGYGVNNVQAAIAFSFFSIFTWAVCAWFAFQRFKQGTDAAFAPTYEADPTGETGYTSYPDAADVTYQDPPFAQQQRGIGDFQAPAY